MTYLDTRTTTEADAGTWASATAPDPIRPSLADECGFGIGGYPTTLPDDVATSLVALQDAIRRSAA